MRRGELTPSARERGAALQQDGREDVLWGGQNPSSACNHQMYRLPAYAGNAELPGPARFGEVLGYFRVVPRYAAAAQISAVGCALGCVAQPLAPI
eukprot:COSAG01_NODE_13229_length_1616_cov_52.368490_2_plen_95_part_00